MAGVVLSHQTSVCNKTFLSKSLHSILAKFYCRHSLYHKNKAMAIAESLIPKIIDELGEVAKKRVNLVLGVDKEVANIEKKLGTIKDVLHDAERRRLKDDRVGKWLEELEDITYEMDDVLDEWNVKIQKREFEQPEFEEPEFEQPTLWSKVRSFILSLCLRLKQLPDRLGIAQKIKKINERLELTLKEACKFNFITSGGVPDFQRPITTAMIDKSKICGAAAVMKKKFLDQVLSESSSHGRDGVQIISVVGAGGSGKTTLAKLLFNNDEVQRHFEPRNWICVSDRFDQIRVAKAILENAGKRSHEAELDPLIRRIKETFSRKRFLLVLDDVWTKDSSKWEPFQDSLKDGAPGSVILVTTRSLEVATAVGTTQTHEMALLSGSDCWLIMKRIAFANKSGDLCKNVESIGKKIAEKCKGLPLAAKTMGSLLWHKETVEQWQNVLDSEIWQLEEELSPEQKLFPHFYFSYNELSPELKRCFSYCAVFPKDYEIFVEELIRLWIAQDYVRPRPSGERLELVGREYFNNLAMRSFFQELEKCEAPEYGLPEYMKCKMHDIVHDFAQFLTKNECHALGGVGRNSSSEKARHLTVLEGTEEEMCSSRVVDFGRLRSFLAFPIIGRVVVPQNLFCRLKCARTLTLSGCELDEIPAEIGRLIHLRHLDLRGCELAEIPTEIGRLIHLRHLDLSGCKLAEIPAEIGRLIHLRHLDLSDNPFVALSEAICDLYYLETLDITDCHELSCLPERIEGLVHLRHLFNHGAFNSLQIPQGLGKLKSLYSLTRFIARNSDDLAILKDLNQLEILRINIEGEVDFEGVELKKKIKMRDMSLFFSFGAHFIETPSCIESMEPPPNLERLVLGGYPGAQLPSWLVTKSHANNLTRLIISGPRNISSLPALWKLSSLRELEFVRVEKLKCLGKEFFGVTKALHENSRDTLDTLSNSESSSSAEAVAFPNLKKLRFENCDNWTRWEDLSEDDEEVAVSITPNLEELEIWYCRKLETLPHRIINKISSLKILNFWGCFKLRDHYSDKTGDDWKQISRIPQVSNY